MSAKPTLQELAIAWLERNVQRNVKRNTPPQQSLPGERAFHYPGTPEDPVSLEKTHGVPLFHPLGLGTAEHPSRTAADAEQWSEREVERLRDHYEEPAAVREYDGGLSRSEAEAGAPADCAVRYGVALKAVATILADTVQGAAASALKGESL